MKKFLGAIFILIIWQLGSLVTTPLFVPSPANVFAAFLNLIKSGQLLHGLLYSFGRITAAAVISILIAIPLALLLRWSKTLSDIVSPVISAMRYIPVTAFSPLLILWFGINETMKISFLFLATFVYVLPSMVLCLDEVPQDLIDTGKSLGMSKREVVFQILFPSALPSIMNSLLMMYGIGWTYVAVVEAVNAKYGLGFIINTSAARGKTDIVFAAILSIVLFSYFFDKLGNIIIKKKFKWRYLHDCIE